MFIQFTITQRRKAEKHQRRKYSGGKQEKATDHPTRRCNHEGIHVSAKRHKAMGTPGKGNMPQYLSQNHQPTNTSNARQDQVNGYGEKADKADRRTKSKYFKTNQNRVAELYAIENRSQADMKVEICQWPLARQLKTGQGCR